MSRHPLAQTLLSLEAAMSAVRRTRGAIHDAADTNARRIARLVDAPGSRLVGDLLPRHVSDVRDTVDNSLKAVGLVLVAQRKVARRLLWCAPAPAPGSGRGHLRDLTPTGEPRVPEGVRFVRRPLILPERFDIDFARQGPRARVCYMAATLAAFAHAAPEFLTHCAREEDDAVVVTMPNGVYRLEATLPIWEDTGEPFSISSPDGSTLAAYVEKAAAAHFGSYKDLIGGIASFPMRWIAGPWDGPRVTMHQSREVTDDQLKAFAEAGRPLVVDVGWQSPEEYPFGEAFVDHFDLVEAHAYAVKTVDERPSLTMRNPWGIFHPQDIPMAELRQVDAKITTLESA